MKDRCIALSGIFAGAGLRRPGSLPPEADLSVYKEAVLAGNATAEVYPGTAFDYVITVANHDPAHSAPDVVVTDKLPYENLLRIEANLFMSFNERVDETFVNPCIP